MKRFIFSIVLLMATTSTQTIFDFNKTADITDWRIEDDRVMGGISQGKFELNDDGHAHFYGIVTSESNGGFSSVQNNSYDLKVDPRNVVRIHLKGDGHAYRFRVKDRQSTYYSYQKSFETNGEWQTIEIKLADMVPTFRGRNVNQPNFDKQHISQIRFLIGTKKVQESFDLLIDKIELVSNE